MQKRLALIIFTFTLIVAHTLVPAYYSSADEALRQITSLSDVYTQLFTATDAFYNIDHHQGLTGVSLSLDIFYDLTPNIVSPAGTRAPPA